MSITKANENQSERFRLLDSQEELIECGTVITADNPCSCYWRNWGCHECPECGGDQSLVHGLLCEACAQRKERK